VFDGSTRRQGVYLSLISHAVRKRGIDVSGVGPPEGGRQIASLDRSYTRDSRGRRHHCLRRLERTAGSRGFHSFDSERLLSTIPSVARFGGWISYIMDAVGGRSASWFAVDDGYRCLSGLERMGVITRCESSSRRYSSGHH